MARKKPWLERHWKWIRDVMLFLTGLSGVIHETVTPGDARPILVGVFVAMLGLPFALKADERREGDE